MNGHLAYDLYTTNFDLLTPTTIIIECGSQCYHEYLIKKLIHARTYILKVFWVLMKITHIFSRFGNFMCMDTKNL